MKSQLSEFDDLVGDEPVCFVEDQWDMIDIINNLTGRDHQIEQQILRSENPEWAYYYSVIKGRWPEAEPFIIKHPGLAYFYTHDIINGRWPEAEPIIMRDPYSAYWYARDIIKGRWPEAEPFIMEDPKLARRYLCGALGSMRRPARQLSYQRCEVLHTTCDIHLGRL